MNMLATMIDYFSSSFIQNRQRFVVLMKAYRLRLIYFYFRLFFPYVNFDTYPVAKSLSFENGRGNFFNHQSTNE